MISEFGSAISILESLEISFWRLETSDFMALGISEGFVNSCAPANAFSFAEMERYIPSHVLDERTPASEAERLLQRMAWVSLISFLRELFLLDDEVVEEVEQGVDMINDFEMGAVSS